MRVVSLTIMAVMLQSVSQISTASAAQWENYYSNRWATAGDHDHVVQVDIAAQAPKSGTLVGDGLRALTRSATEAWNAAGSDLVLDYNGEADPNDGPFVKDSCTSHYQDNQVGWTTLDGNSQTGSGEVTQQTYTCAQSYDGTFARYNFMLAVDKDEFWSFGGVNGTPTFPGPTQIDFQSVITHELGHGTGRVGAANNDGHYEESNGTFCPGGPEGTSNGRETMCPSIGPGFYWGRTLGGYDSSDLRGAYP